MRAGVNLLKYIDASLVAICLPNDRYYRLVAPSCSPGFSQNLPGWPSLAVCVYAPQCYLGCSHRLLSHHRQKTYSPSMSYHVQTYHMLCPIIRPCPESRYIGHRPDHSFLTIHLFACFFYLTINTVCKLISSVYSLHSLVLTLYD